MQLILTSIYEFLLHSPLFSFEEYENHVWLTSFNIAKTCICLSKFHWRSLNMSRIFIGVLVLANCKLNFLKLHYCTILVHLPGTSPSSPSPHCICLPHSCLCDSYGGNFIRGSYAHLDGGKRRATLVDWRLVECLAL